MKYLSGFAAFWYDFVVGDAWEVAVGVVGALLFIGVLAGFAPQFTSLLGPIFVVAILAIMAASLWYEQRGRQ